MEGQIHEGNEKKITLNLDEFDIDSYDFKPVTKGLGFHEPKKKEKAFTPPIPKEAKRARTSTQRLSVQTNSKNNYLQSTPLSVSDPSLMSGIEALYASESKKSEVKPKEETHQKKAKKTLTSAGLGEQSLAFFIDLGLVLLLSTLLTMTFLFFAARTLNIELFYSFIMASLPYCGTLLALIFVTYFSITEPLGTVGKKALGLGTYDVKSQRRITIRNSFVRSLTTLFSFFLLCLPIILDFQGKLSESRVAKDK